MLATTNSTPINQTSFKAARSDASIKSQVFRQWRLERRVLRMRADVAEVFGPAGEFQVRRSRVVAVGGNGHGGQVVFPVRQREAETEGAVVTQFDFVSAKRDFGVRLGRAVNDQLGVDVEPEAF